MSSVMLDESTPDLAALIDQLTPGEELTIFRDGLPVATLRATASDEPSATFTTWSVAGSTLELQSPVFAAEAAAKLQQLLDAERSRP
ncbi:MAG: hypothetical protein ACRC8S_09640 [Fimbriiglobus sp.]